jgi:hypothetical protein
MFLHRHRLTFLPAEKKRRALWIDAICIDQTNLDERSKQAAFMADVYKEAKTGIAWLGEESYASRMALDVPLGHFNDKISDERENALTNIFDSGYRDRLWIVQELCHAQQIIVRCGSLEIDWHTLSQFADYSSRGVEWALFSVTAIDFLRVTRETERREGPSQNGLLVLNLYGSRGCLDAKDSVYALRSLDPCLMSVAPDYSLSTASVLTAATRTIISSQLEWVGWDFLDTTNRRKPSP